MPVVVAVVAAYAASAIATSAVVIAAVGTYGAMALGAMAAMAINAIGGAILGGGKGGDTPQPIAQTAHDQKVTVQSSSDPRRLIYGTVKASGPLALAYATGSNNNYMHLVIPLASQRIMGIGDVYFSNDLSTSQRFPQPSASAWVSGTSYAAGDVVAYGIFTNVSTDGNNTITTGTKIWTRTSVAMPAAVCLPSGVNGSGSSLGSDPKAIPPDLLPLYWMETSSNARLKRYDGRLSQVADADLVSEIPSWASTARGVGVSYLYGRLLHDSTVFPQGLPSLTPIINGGLVYDPRQTGIAIASSTAGTPGVFETDAAHNLVPGQLVFLRDHSGKMPGRIAGLPDVLVSKTFEVLEAPSAATFTLLGANGSPVQITTGGTGGTVTPCAWSRNAALCILDFFLSPDGFDCRVWEIDWSNWAAQANVCDEYVSLCSSQTATADATAHTFTLAGMTNWSTAAQVFISSTGTVPAGLTAGTPYYVINTNPDGIGPATSYQLAASLDDAANGNPIAFTSAGSGTLTISTAEGFSADPDSDTLTVSLTVNYGSSASTTLTAQPGSVAFSIGTGDKVTFGTTGTLPAPLVAGTTYYWIMTGVGTARVATSLANANAGIYIDLTDAGSGNHTVTPVAQLRYTCDGTIDLSKNRSDILKALLTSAAAVNVYVQGKHQLFVAAATAPTAALTESDMRDGVIDVQAHANRQTIFNAVRGTYIDPCRFFEATDFPQVLNGAYEANDGGDRIYSDIQLSYTSDPTRAQRIASIGLNRARADMTIKYPVNISALTVTAWDVLTLTSPTLGLSAAQFRVQNWQLAQDGAGIDLVLQAEDPTAYSWNGYQAATVAFSPPNNVPLPWAVQPPTGLTLSSTAADMRVAGDGTLHSQIKVSWTAPADVFVVNGGRIWLQYKKSSDSTWISLLPALGDQTSAYIPDVVDDTPYDVQIKAVNTLAAASNWVTVTGFVVTSSLISPSDITGLTSVYVGGVSKIIWQSVTDARPIDYEIRQGGTWASAQLVGRTLLTETPSIGDGTYWVAARYLAPSGAMVYSLNPQSIVISGSVLVRNVVAGFDESATGWAGSFPSTMTKMGSELWLAPAGDILSCADILALTDALYYGGVASSGTYAIPVGHRVNVGRVAACNIVATASVRGQLVSDNILSVPDIFALTDVLNTAIGHQVSAQIQVRIAQANGVYGAWRDYSPGSYIGQYFDFRVILSSYDPSIIAALSAFSFEVDVPDRIDTFTAISVPAGGLTISYASGLQGNPAAAFNGGPNGQAYPNVQVTALSAQPGDDPATVTAQSEAGFTVQFLNGGVGVARLANIISQGY